LDGICNYPKRITDDIELYIIHFDNMEESPKEILIPPFKINLFPYRFLSDTVILHNQKP
jgi:hypothetical protein